jgi:hypothetical protein
MEIEFMLIGITGPIGSGKTLFMTRCIYKEKMRRPEVNVATNYKLNGIDFKFINASDLFDIKQQLKDTILGIDEFHIFLDSRSFMKPSNQQLTHFILQTRHLGVNLYFTTQDISQVDLRLRRQLDFLAYCSPTPYENYFKVKIVDYRDVLNIHTNDFVYDGSPYYDLFDTTEIIDFMQPEVKKEKHYEVKEKETITYTRRKRTPKAE